MDQPRGRPDVRRNADPPGAIATQRREDQLAGHREQLTLELGIFSEQKSAKIIQLLEELRRDTPFLENRVDAEAVAMSVPTDLQSVLDAIKESHEEQAMMDLDRGPATDYDASAQAGSARAAMLSIASATWSGAR